MRKKIGIVAPFQNGDLITVSSVLQYRDELWPDCDIVWFCNEPHSDALKYQDVEIRYFPHGWGILENDFNGIYRDRVLKDKLAGRPEWEDWSVLMNNENRLKQELKNKFSSFTDLSDAYFPVPWMLSISQRHGISYPDCSKQVFKIPMEWEWHPVLSHSDEEKIKAITFIEKLPATKILLFETFAGSDQSKITHEMVIESIRICKEKWKGCSIIFVSHKYLRSQEQFPEGFFEQEGIYSASEFTVRQCALLTHYSHLMISVSSGITVSCSAWEMKPIPIIQFTGSFICSTKSIALGQFELVTYDDKPMEVAKQEFYHKLEQLLIQHK